MIQDAECLGKYNSLSTVIYEREARSFSVVLTHD